MSSEDLARVTALYLKADELEAKGHLLRAADYYGRAADAARAPFPEPDNLVAVNLQRCQTGMLLGYLSTVDDATVDPQITAAQRADSVALLSAVVDALERRRVAGTLLEGKCTAAEEAWYAARLSASAGRAALAASQAKLVGTRPSFVLHIPFCA